MALYSLRTENPTRGIFSFGRTGFGALAYPIVIRDGQTWIAQMKFRHKGPAETITIMIGPYISGVTYWAQTSMVVGEDAVEKEYISKAVGAVFNSHGLGGGRLIDTNLAIKDSSGVTTYASDGSTDRFKTYATASRMFSITGDRYGEWASGYRDWVAT